MTVIREADVIASVADALQYISYYHSPDFIRAMGRAYDVEQSPAAGTTDVTSPHVDLLVSLGTRPPAFLMPELTGLPLNEAESRLAAAGLKVSKLTPASIPGTPHGVVVGQTPLRGKKLDESTAVELQFAE